MLTKTYLISSMFTSRIRYFFVNRKVEISKISNKDNTGWRGTMWVKDRYTKVILRNIVVIKCGMSCKNKIPFLSNCVCVKCITLCNCLCSSSLSSLSPRSSRDFDSVIQNIGKFGKKNYFTDHRTANTIYGFRDSVPVLKMHDCY